MAAPLNTPPSSAAAQQPASPVRRIALACAFIALVALVFSGYTLAQRVAAFYEASPPDMFLFQPVDARQFNYAGRPVTIADEPPTPGSRDRFLTVTYGTDVQRLRVAIPGHDQLPGLAAHEEWLKVLRFARLGTARPEELLAQMNEGTVPDRLAIVTRTPRPGSDPRTWGQVWRRDWTFDFYEFLPDGGFRHEKLGFPTTRRYQDAAPDELKEGTWQFQAALAVMPSGWQPKYKFNSDGLSAAGPWLAAAEVSILVLIASLAVYFAPRRKNAQPKIDGITPP